MRFLFLLIIQILLLVNLAGQNKYFQVEVSQLPYEELVNPTFLCQDSIGIRHNFTADPPLQILDEAVDSFYIMNWSTLHLAVGNKKSKETDLFVPFNTGLRRKTNTADSVGFSISYEIKGDIGNRVIRVQWKDVKPKSTVAPNDVFNVQMIIDERDQSVSYHFGPMPPEFNTLFSLFGQGRQPALYFIDDFNSFSAPRNEFYSITSSYMDVNKIVLEKFILLDAVFSDEQFSNYLLYYCPSIPLQSGVIFKIYLKNISSADDLISGAESLHIYPNPAIDEIHFTSAQWEHAPYEILNSSGLAVQRGVIENNSIRIDMLSHGIHFLKWVSDRGEVHIEKFIKL